jgi:hypothetical protein
MISFDEIGMYFTPQLKFDDNLSFLRTVAFYAHPSKILTKYCFAFNSLIDNRLSYIQTRFNLGRTRKCGQTEALSFSMGEERHQ